MPGTVLAQLDRDTRPEHADANRGWLRLVESPDITRDDYVQQLRITYGLEAPYESACAYTPGLAQMIDLRGRWRSGLIAQDLLALGWVPNQLTNVKCYSLAPFQDAAEALGWMYVVEHTTLLHRQVQEELTTRFVDLSRACAYLTAFENVVSRRRAELGVALDRLCTSDRVFDRVLDAAKAAFGASSEWHRANHPGLRSVG